MIHSDLNNIFGCVVIAMLLDWFWGEPPSQFHPVVWMGSYLAWIANKIAPRVEEKNSLQKISSFLSGFFFWCTGGFLVTALAWGIHISVQHVDKWFAILIAGFF